MIAGEPLNRGGDEDDTTAPGGSAGASVTAIPKATKPRKPRDGGMEPEPTA